MQLHAGVVFPPGSGCDAWSDPIAYEGQTVANHGCPNNDRLTEAVGIEVYLLCF